MFKIHFWDTSEIRSIQQQVANEFNITPGNVKEIINDVFLNIRREIVSPNSFRKILIHNFGSFYPNNRYIHNRIRFLWRKYREDPTEKLYYNLKELFKIRKLIKNGKNS